MSAAYRASESAARGFSNAYDRNRHVNHQTLVVTIKGITRVRDFRILCGYTLGFSLPRRRLFQAMNKSPWAT